MTYNQKLPGPLGATVRAMKTLPDRRAALEALVLFLLMIGAGALAVTGGALVINPMPREQLIALSLPAFVIPALGEEIVFRSWLQRGKLLGAAASLLTFVAWHPFQVMAGLPYGRSAFLEPVLLLLAGLLGLACTVSRLRSGSIWLAVIIHWGVVVAWLGVTGG